MNSSYVMLVAAAWSTLTDSVPHQAPVSPVFPVQLADVTW